VQCTLWGGKTKIVKKSPIFHRIPFNIWYALQHSHYENLFGKPIIQLYNRKKAINGIKTVGIL
jgi:hypothetical protein